MQSRAGEQQQQQPDAIAKIPFNLINFAESFASERGVGLGGGGGREKQARLMYRRVDGTCVMRGR